MVLGVEDEDPGAFGQAVRERVGRVGGATGEQAVSCGRAPMCSAMVVRARSKVSVDRRDRAPQPRCTEEYAGRAASTADLTSRRAGAVAARSKSRNGRRYRRPAVR